MWTAASSAAGTDSDSDLIGDLDVSGRHRPGAARLAGPNGAAQACSTRRGAAGRCE